MFYGDPDFGKTNDKPLFNLTAFKNCRPGEIIKVQGQINFEHLGVQYSLIKVNNFKAAINAQNTKIDSTELILKTLINDNWEVFSGDVPNKINTILPRGLSKYFLLDGERARDIVLNSKDLMLAIHSLFGLDTYANALYHIGNKNKKYSVLGYYNSLLLSKMTSVVVNNMTPSEMQNNIQELYEDIEEYKKNRHDIIDSIDALNNRNEEILKVLGEANNRDSIQQLIKMNTDAIKSNEETISKTKKRIGELFYKCYPYLFLSRMASMSSAILREKNKDFASSYKNVFEHLSKDLLKEIIDKNICICDRPLDTVSTKKINDIIACMPPDSYTYQFGQFVSKSRHQIQLSQLKIMDYDGLITEISECENKIAKYEDSNREKLDDLKRLDDARALVDEFEKNKQELSKLNSKKSFLEGTIAQKKQVFDVSNRQLNNMLKNQNVSSEFNSKIQFFESLRQLLELEKSNRELKVRETLNSCVRDIFKKLTTQTEINADRIQFVNDDFSLRTTFLTGGQLAVDEYSYVIGIIKALQECNMDNNENPIIIDAPFAFTGIAQSEHIFKTLPEVSKQTVLLTLDLNKIKNLMGYSEMYDFYIIKNQTQEQATLFRGNINDIKF
jgi:hypothetical protein